MSRYVFYREYQSILMNVWRKAMGISWKQLKRQGITREKVLRELSVTPGFCQSLEGIITIEENDYQRLGRHVLIPRDSDLLAMLWRSRMNVTIEDLAAFPRAFTVAWPRSATAADVKLVPCLVWFGQVKYRSELVPACSWLPNGFQLDSIAEQEDSYCFHLTYGGGKAEQYQCYRVSIPERNLQQSLKSESEMVDTIGSYDNPFVRKLNNEEMHKQYVHVKMVLNLLVYATACPEAVLHGWPQEFGDSPLFRNLKPVLLASPVPRGTSGDGTHVSPITHWRNPYFRSYPIRKDGTRKKGIVAVRGGMVNAELDPETIIHVKK